jgi:hypothetical protein
MVIGQEESYRIRYSVALAIKTPPTRGATAYEWGTRR